MTGLASLVSMAPAHERERDPKQPPEQEERSARLAELLGADERVRGVWLTGSLGRGTADRFSDIDMLLVVESNDRLPFAEQWPRLVTRLAAPLLTKTVVPPFVFAHVLPGWLRWDVAIGTSDDLADLPASAVRALVDKDGVAPGPEIEARPPDPATVLALTEEFIRVLGLLPVVIGRGELVTAASGACLLRGMTTSLLRMRVEGRFPSGALHLSRVLPGEPMEQLRCLPPLSAEAGSAIALHLACARLLLPAARSMLGADYPHRLERACWEHLARELDL